jgi:hypothetical protein
MRGRLSRRHTRRSAAACMVAGNRFYEWVASLPLKLVLQRGELVLDDVGDELWVDAEVLVHHDVA